MKYVDRGEPGLTEYRRLFRELRFAGLDLGSKAHPSHLAILNRDRRGVHWQIVSKWWDRRPLSEVVREAQDLCHEHGVSVLCFDATRGELQVLHERGELPGSWVPVVFTREVKQRIAGRLALALERGELKLLADDRQRRQLLTVDQLLKATETADGHGDCFWSLALALEASALFPLGSPIEPHTYQLGA